MKRTGKRTKSILALALSLAMFLQCPTVSATAESNGDTQSSTVTTEQTAGAEAKDNTVQQGDQGQQIKKSQAAETTYVNGVEFTVTSDGTAPFDAPEANGNDQRGNDSSKTNGRIRSYDQMTYEVKTSFQAESDVSVAGKKLYYAITVPNTDNLELDWQASGLEEEVKPKVNADGTKTYTYSFAITTQQAEGSGGIGRTVVLNVLGMKEGQTFQPSVKCWIEGNEENHMPNGQPAQDTQGKAANVATASETYVTSAPAYNIMLKKGSVSGLSSFKFGSADSKNAFDDTTYQATGYADNTVKGYAVTWGVGVEMRKADASKGIRGIEYPDPSQPLTFDVDLSDVKYESGKTTTSTASQWAPLLYRVRPNHENYGDHVSVGDLPGSGQDGQVSKSRYCLDSGNYTVTQDGTTLHFTIKDYQIDRAKFPKESLNGKDNYYTDLKKILEGVFTSAQFTAVYPMVNSQNEDIQEELGESGNYKFKAFADNLKATSIDGTETDTETIPLNAAETDNISETQANVVGGHGRTHEIYFSSKGAPTEGSDGGQTGSMKNKGNDSDSGTLGSQIFFTTCWNETNASTAIAAEGRTVAADQLVLLEGDAIEIVQAARNDHDKTATRGYYLYPMYVTADHALNFEETKTLTMDSTELHYYSDLKDVPAGQHIVGVLLRWRGISYSINKDGKDENAGSTGALLINQTVANIKNDAAYADQVYAITVQSKLYDTSILPDVTAKFTDGETEQEKAEAYRQAARGLLGDGPLVTTRSDLAPEANGTLDGRSQYTTKPNYDSTGYHGGTVFGRDHADSLYVVPYYTQITKTIAQKDKNGNQKNTYNLDRAERYVDYKLTSTLNFSDSGMSYADGQKTTTITIKDTIPAGLTYVTDSAVWNPDSYTEVAGKPGKLTGGTPKEPVITDNANGTKTLTWTIENVKVANGALPPLYYTCSIDGNVENNQNLNNTATIQSSEEKRAICAANKNTSDAGIKITRSSGFNINKYGDHDLELNDDATFTLVASNATNNPRKNFLLVDSMPYDGQNGTVMKGKYNVTSLTINSDPNVIGANGTDDIEVYYTTDAKYQGKTDINAFPVSEVRNSNIWTKAAKITAQADEDPSWDVKGWPTAIAIYDVSLGSNNTLLATLHYKAVADKDDHLVNYLLTTGASTSTVKDHADAVIYDRALSGTVWVDDNFDGKMDKTEERVSGVQVQLMKQDANGDWQVVTSYQDKDGKTCSGTQYTNDQGYYEFTKLPEGKYKVVFTNGDTTKHPESDLSQYYMTSKNADKNNTKITSKTDTVKSDSNGKLQEGDITGISMPSIEEMKAKNYKNGHYELPDQNMGLYRVQRSISGLAWFDANGDGVYDKDAEGDQKEYPMAGVKASLYVKNEKGAFVPYSVDGQEVSTVTGADGSYSFDKLPAGDYEVVFSDGTEDSSKISDFIVTGQNGQAKPAVRSVAEAGENGTAVVRKQNQENNPDSAITLMTDAQLIDKKQSKQTIPNLNAGFKPSKTQITVTKVWNDENDADQLRPSAEDFAGVLTLNRYTADNQGQASGEATAVTDRKPEITTNQDGSFTIQYTDLPTVSFDGTMFTKYVYTVKEGSVEGYTTDQTEVKEGETITNTHTPDKPYQPEEPDKPQQPKNPGKPPKDTPQKPGQPTAPNKSSNPAPKTQKSKANPSNSATLAPVKTGDNSHMEVYIALILIAGAVLVLASIRNRKNRQQRTVK